MAVLTAAFNGIYQLAFDLVILYWNLALLENRDFIQGHIQSQIILQTIDADKFTVEFFFIDMKLNEFSLPYRLQGITS